MGEGPQRIIVPKDRIFDRAQGCWNCKHWDTEAALKKWLAPDGVRAQNLQKAVDIAIESPNGEADTRVYNIRGMVDRLDQEIVKGSAGVCNGKGRDPHGNPVGDFVVHNYLCNNWSGKQGASMTREGKGLDKLPEELQEELDGPMSDTQKLSDVRMGGSLVKKGVV